MNTKIAAPVTIGTTEDDCCLECDWYKDVHDRSLVGRVVGGYCTLFKKDLKEYLRPLEHPDYLDLWFQCCDDCLQAKRL